MKATGGYILDMFLALLVGFAFGFFGSMPVAGPISVLVLHLGLGHDPRHGLYVAIGGALAEGFYALLAFWGLSTVLDHYPMILPASNALGAFILLGFGIALLCWKAKAALPDAPPQKQKGNKRSFAAGLLITAINPTLIVTWTAAVAALHSTGLLAMSQDQAIPFALGACGGIVAWFSTLLWLVARFRSNWSATFLARFMKVMGAILLVVGGWMAVRALAYGVGVRKRQSAVVGSRQMTRVSAVL